MLRNEDHIYETFPDQLTLHQRKPFSWLQMASLNITSCMLKCLQLVKSGTTQECERFRSNLFSPMEKEKKPQSTFPAHAWSLKYFLGLSNSALGSHLLTKDLKLIPMVDNKQLFTYYGLSSRKISVLIWFSKLSGLLCHVFLVLQISL